MGFFLLQASGVIAILGPSIQVDMHRHHALQLTVALSGPFTLTCQGSASLESGVLLAADLPHQVEGEDCLILLLEPESHLAVQLRERYLREDGLARLPEAILEACQRRFREERESGTQEEGLRWEHIAWFLQALHEGICWQRHLDERVQKVLSWLDHLEETEDLASATLEAAHKQTYLSESRFLHLFSEQVGVPWRRYLRWRRLIGAVQWSLKGASFTESAHHAGFADSSHLTRVFREMFGINPRVFLGYLEK
ncbi:MAG: helix-turn-helix domain-containing protein [Myxococcales bacterium]|nr:helix-turn-helix domain-containing protein [Myxococcales bacterium]